VQDGLVGIAPGCGLDGQEIGFDSWQGQEFFRFFTASRVALGPTQPLWASGALSLGVKWHEAGHQPSFSAKVKNGGGYTSTSPYVFMVCLIKNNHNFTFTFGGDDY
jgi:hypothetical protein